MVNGPGVDLKIGVIGIPKAQVQKILEALESAYEAGYEAGYDAGEHNASPDVGP